MPLKGLTCKQRMKNNNGSITAVYIYMTVNPTPQTAQGIKTYTLRHGLDIAQVALSQTMSMNSFLNWAKNKLLSIIF